MIETTTRSLLRLLHILKTSVVTPAKEAVSRLKNAQRHHGGHPGGSRGPGCDLLVKTCLQKKCWKPGSRLSSGRHAFWNCDTASEAGVQAETSSFKRVYLRNVGNLGPGFRRDDTVFGIMTQPLQRIFAAWAFVGLGFIPLDVKAMVQSISIDVETRVGGEETTSFQAAIIDALHPLEAEEEPATMTEIEWPLINPDENPGWQIARSAVRLEWSVTSAFGGIQIYTDNMNADANPRFEDPTPDDRHNPDSNPAGLVLVHPQGERSRETLPMGWSIKPNRRALDEDIQAGDPDKGPAQGPGNRYQWFYIVDLNTPAIDLDGIDADGDGIRWNDPDDGREFTNGDSYITVANHRGIHGSNGPEDFFVDEDRVSYIYFMANFSGAAVQDQYRTNRLILEAFYE